MAEAIAAEETQALESTTVGIYRTATVVKGGRRFSFAALVVVGDRAGAVGIGYGKAPGVPAAIEKAQKDARKQLFKIALHDGTVPHPVTGRHGASKVLMAPAAPGTGVIASGTVRAVLEMAGVQDCLTKGHGSNNKKNVCKAVIEGLQTLRTKDTVAKQRNVTIDKTEVDERIEAAQRFMVETAGEEAATSEAGKDSGEGKGGASHSSGGEGKGVGGGRSEKVAQSEQKSDQADQSQAAEQPDASTGQAEAGTESATPESANTESAGPESTDTEQGGQSEQNEQDSQSGA